MEGYQYGHVETWSRAGSTGTVHHERAEGGARRRWTTEEILDEAERLASASLHVERGGPAPQIIPAAVGSFKALRAAHAAAAGIKETFDYTDPKTKEKKKRSRALRRDARTLYTAVFSLPVMTADALAVPELRAECLAVLQAAIDHERDRIVQRGGVLAMSVVHWDEAMVHVHVYALDPKYGRVDALHPGVVAKAECMSNPRALTLNPKDRNKAGNRAYCEAMRAWQDDLHAEVFAPAGLLRAGPRRERLTRADYLHAKRVAGERREDEERKLELAEGVADLAHGFRELAAHTRSMSAIAAADLETTREWEQDLTEREAAAAAAVERAEADRKAAERERDAAARMIAEAVRTREEAADERRRTDAARAETEAARAIADRDREAAARDRKAAAQDRAATENYFEVTPLALAAGEVKIMEYEEDGARLSPGTWTVDAARQAQIDAAHAAAPKAVRRSLARVWGKVTDAARAAMKPFEPDGLMGRWRDAFDYLRSALLREQARLGDRVDTTGATPCETAVVALAAAVRNEDRTLGDDLRRAAFAARERRRAQETQTRDAAARSDRSAER
jgi:hypothetical protein